MTQNILQALITAVKSKSCVAIRYYDQSESRVIEPHAVYTAENGEIVVDAYQTRGYSSSGRPPPFWRPFRLKKITAITPLKERFATRIREGFMPHKAIYRRNLIMMVDHGEQAPFFPQAAGDEMGPQLPAARRR